MSRNHRKAVGGGLIWLLLGVLLSAALVAAVACLVVAQSNGVVHQESVALEMSWKRGDNHYGPNFIHLESPCLSNPEPGCFCALDFKTTTSKEFADYVESFGNHSVPVKFHVDYDRNHQVVGAILEAVAEWPEKRFHIIKERSLATGFRMLRTQHTSGGHLNNPADCFPKSAK
jgi:hypothetical protein